LSKRPSAGLFPPYFADFFDVHTVRLQKIIFVWRKNSSLLVIPPMFKQALAADAPAGKLPAHFHKAGPLAGSAMRIDFKQAPKDPLAAQTSAGPDPLIDCNMYRRRYAADSIFDCY